MERLDSIELFNNTLKLIKQLKDYKMNKLSDFIFHLNPVTKNWEAVTRDHYNDLFCNNSKTLKSKDINVLIELISKTGGDLIEINKLLENE